MMDAAFIETIIEKARPQTFEAEGNTYVHPDYNLKKPLRPRPVELDTLAGLVDFIKINLDKLETGSIMVHVASPTKVELFSRLDNFSERSVYATASSRIKPFRFDTFHSTEEFRIGLMSCFQMSVDETIINNDEYKSDDRYLLEITSGITEETAKEILDDGVHQHTILRNGFALHGQRKALRPTVTLRPYRTFREIEEQPSSPFVFRVKGKDGEVRLGLWEADGGAWELEAVCKIQAHLTDALAGTNVPVIA